MNVNMNMNRNVNNTASFLLSSLQAAGSKSRARTPGRAGSPAEEGVTPPLSV
jgi:hypothetical protein